jgi:glutathione S-transferase
MKQPDSAFRGGSNLAPEARLAPASGTMARVRLQVALHHIATEIHQGTARSSIPRQRQRYGGLARRICTPRYALIDDQLAGRTYCSATNSPPPTPTSSS